MATKISRKALATYLAENIGREGIAEEVATLLVESNQVADLESLMRDLNTVRSEKHGVVEVTARSAYPLDSQSKEDIESLARKLFPAFTQLIIQEVRDETVIGGVDLNFPGLNLDLTLRRKLNKLKELAV